MLVEGVLPVARERLVAIEEDAPVVRAAELRYGARQSDRRVQFRRRDGRRGEQDGHREAYQPLPRSGMRDLCVGCHEPKCHLLCT